jgi:DNA-binding transcriptional LysR family regulator
MKRYAGKQLGRVRIGTGSTASIHLLPQVLRRIRNTAPEIEISVITGDSASMADALSENLIDLALINLPRQRRGLVVERTLADPLVGVVPRSAGDVPPALTPGDFKRLPLILYERGGAMRRVIDDWFLSAHVTVQPSMELGDVEGAKRFVSAGLGWSILPSIAVSNKDPDILTRPLRPGLRRSLAVMLRQDKVRDHAIRSALRAFASL